MITLTGLLAVASFALVFWSELQFRNHGPVRFHHAALSLFADQAEVRWDEANPVRTRDFLQMLENRFQSHFQWVDAEGNDLIGDQDHPELFDFRRQPRLNPPPPANIKAYAPPRPVSAPTGEFAFLGPTTSGKYNLVEWVVPPPPQVPLVLFGIISTVLGLFGLLMAIKVARPIRQLETIVQEFGRGNFLSRSLLNRPDEIGQLASSFNQMADQIQLLVERERGVVRSVAHELRSPLTRMSLLLERLRNGKNVDQTIERIDAEIKSLSQIPDVLLQLSLIESGQASVMSQKFKLGEFLRSLTEKMEPLAGPRGISFQFQNMEIDLELSTDPALLGRSLENIMENAIRHSPEPGVIDVNIADQTDSIEIIIRDQGPGVPEQDISSIFRPFFRCDFSRNRHTGGLGLGLAITRSSIEALGGKVWAENAEPGLRVTVSLPHSAPSA